MRIFKRALMLLTSIAIVFVLVACGNPAATKPKPQKGDLQSLTVQFVPSVNAKTLAAKVKPLEKLLSSKLGIPVHVSVAGDYNTIVAAMGTKKVDMGFLPPATYTIVHQKYAATAILQAQRFGVQEPTGAPTDKLTTSYAAEVLVRKDAGINSINDLRGKQIAVQAPTSDAGYIFPRVELAQKGIQPSDYTAVPVNGHDQAVLAVENKDVEAAFVFNDARNMVKGDVPTIFNDTKIIYMTAPIPNDTVTLRAGISAQWQKKIANAMQAIVKTKQGHDIMSTVYSWEGVAPANDANFAIVRKYERESAQLK